MKPETTEWVAIAEEDFATASREQAVVERPNFSAACFHAQQSAEKYLKALLVEKNIYFPKTHNLMLLAKLVGKADIDLAAIGDQLRRLTPFGIDVRYPGGRPDADAAREALSDCTAVRAVLRQSLGLAT